MACGAGRAHTAEDADLTLQVLNLIIEPGVLLLCRPIALRHRLQHS